jgi:hypothetical protein
MDNIKVQTVQSGEILIKLANFMLWKVNLQW